MKVSQNVLLTTKVLSIHSINTFTVRNFTTLVSWWKRTFSLIVMHYTILKWFNTVIIYQLQCKHPFLKTLLILPTPYLQTTMKSKIQIFMVNETVCIHWRLTFGVNGVAGKELNKYPVVIDFHKEKSRIWTHLVQQNKCGYNFR